MNILGLNAYHGDVSAALVRDGRVIAAVEEERFRRIKHCAGFPERAIAECLRLGGISPADVDVFKVMGLAPYGEPRYVDELRQLVDLGPNGTFSLDLSYFSHWCSGVQMTWDDGEPTIGSVFTPKLEALLGQARRAEEPLEPRHEAVAASLQAVFEEAALHVLRHVRETTKAKRLCYAGGCAMNSVANGKIREATGFDDVFIQPAAGDNGTALGAAFHAWHESAPRPRDFVME